MDKNLSPYQIVRIASEIWLVPENFPAMKELKKAVQKINDKELSLTAKETDALQALVGNPYLIRIKQ